MKKLTTTDIVIVVLVAFFIISLSGAFFHLGIKYGRNNEPMHKEKTTTKRAKVTTSKRNIQNGFVNNQVIITFYDKIDKQQRQLVMDSLPNLDYYSDTYDIYVANLLKNFKNISELNKYCNELKEYYSEIKYCDANHIITIPDCNNGPC